MKIAAFFVFLGLVSVPNGVSAQESESGYYKSFDGTRIHFEKQGKGFPVLLVHGFMNQGSDWKKVPMYQSLVDSGFTVVTVDLRGNGLSDKPENMEAYMNDAEARDLEGLMKFLRYKKYNVVGYSRGSIITTRLLIRDHHTVKGVLGGMGADFTNPDWPRRISFYEALSNDSVPGFEGVRKRIKENGLNQKVLAMEQKEQPSASRQELATLKNKVLVICGREDHDNGNGADLAALIPGAVFREVPGNHGGAWHEPEFSAVVISFLLKK